MVQFVLGILYASFLEWFIHKYILHGLGQNPKSKFSFHWINHHRLVRLNKYRDPSYDNDSLFGWNPRTQEIAWLGVVASLHLWLFWVAPIFAVTIFSWMVLYYMVHFLSHKFPKFGEKVFPWHYRHHMDKNQHRLYGVVTPIWDYIFGNK